VKFHFGTRLVENGLETLIHAVDRVTQGPISHSSLKVIDTDCDVPRRNAVGFVCLHVCVCVCVCAS
jgi:hypothetical protein